MNVFKDYMYILYLGSLDLFDFYFKAKTKVLSEEFYWKCYSVWDKPNLFGSTSLCLVSSQYAIFSQSLTNQIIGSDILMKVFKDYIYIRYLGNLGLFNILSKNKAFESGVLLKMLLT